MTIICLEGPDLSGKSTLAGEFMSLGGPRTLIKRGPIREDPMIEYLRPFDVLTQGDWFDRQQILVLDRWHVGELIYGPLLRGGSELTTFQANYLEMVMASLGCLFIHVTAPVPVLEDRWDIRGDSLVKREWLHEISDKYWQHVSTRRHWVSYVLGTGRTWLAGPYLPSVPASIEDQLVGRYIGPPRPLVLLLGDERASDEFTWPFVPRRATSGHWLMGALQEGGVDHMRIGIVNACELTTETLNTLWSELGKPLVVTLGRNAERAWRRTDAAALAETTYLHHPQYQRRFHFSSYVEYGRAIRQVMR